MASTRFSFDLVANVGRFRRGFRAADRTVRGFSSRLGFLRSRLTQVTGALAAFFGARQLVRGFRSIISEASDLETQMARVQAVSGATADEMRQLRRTAEEMGERTTFTAIQSAQAMEQLARAGLTASEQIETIPQVLEFAEANSLQLAEAASIVTGAVNGMNMEFSESQRVTDVLTRAAQNADASVQDLGNALSFAAPTAASLGLEIEQTTSLIGALADAGLDGSRAGTALNQVLIQFTDTTSKFRRELREAGIETDDFGEMLRELERAGPRAEAAVNALGSRGGPALRILLAQGSDAIDDLTRRLGEAEGASADAAETMRDTLSGSISLLQSAWNTLRRELGDPLLSRVRQGVDDLAQGIRNFVNSDDLGRLQEALVATWDRGRAAIDRFLADFDISEAVGRVTGTIDRVTSAFGRMASAGQAAAATVRIAWNTINSVVAGIMNLIANSVAGVMRAVASAAEGLDRLGLVSEQAARRARMHAEAMNASAEALRDHAIESGGRAWQATLDLGEAFNDLTSSQERATTSTQEHTESTADLGDQAEETAAQIETLGETLDRVADAAGRQGGGLAEGLGNANAEIETLDETLDGLPDSVDAVGDAAERMGEEAGEGAREAGDAARQTINDVEDTAEAAIGASTSAVGAVSAALRNKYREVSDAAEAAFDRLQERAVGTGATVGAFFRRLADGRDRLDRQIEREREQLARMQAQIERASNSQEDLARVARMSTNDFELLGDQQLEPVRRAIADAQRRLEGMRDSARDTLRTLQDELLQLRGEEEELAERRRERQREEIRQELQQAESAGDAETVSRLNEALRTLDQISREERRQRREEAEQQRRREQERERASTREQRRARQEDEVARERERRRQRESAPTRTVRIQAGSAAVDVPEHQAERFIDELERLGARTS